MATFATRIITKQHFNNQIHDLTAKYDALENQYKTTKLENKEYRHQIAVLHHQNIDLQKELSHYKDHHHHNEQHLKPMLDAHINSIESSLETHNEHIEILQGTNQKYLQQLNNLKSENITIKQQIKKYQIALENSTKQKDILKQIHNDTLAENNKQINQLEHELHLLRQQLHSMQAIKIGVSTPDHYKTAMLPDRIPIIGFLKSDVEENPFQFANMLPRKNTVLSSHLTSNDSLFFAYNRTRSRGGTFDTPVHMCIDEMGYEERLEKLTIENAMLMKKLNILQVDDEKCEKDLGYKFIEEDDDDIMNEFDDEDINEMEHLFRKCDAETMMSAKRRNVKRYSNNNNVFHWISWYHMFK